jgi:molybdenum cofactor cytidylyltransferase
MKKTNHLAILILAAGTSSRLGYPKQLVTYKNESLLKIAIKKALEISTDVFVVLGHEKKICENEIKNFNVKILYNKEYKKGMGSSLSFGISHTKVYENTMIMLCDQPLIPISHYKTLITHIKYEKICASFYNGSLSVPVIFPKKYYKKLLELNVEKGAKSILKPENCIKISLLKKYSVDIDIFDDIVKYLY